MRNPVEEFQRARSMPITELEKVMLGQSDAISMAVAHAALKEKLETKVAQQGANAAAQAQAPKVRDKDLAMARGLTSLPADIPMTPGGITGVPMAGGGEVKRFQAGGQQMSLPGFPTPSTGPDVPAHLKNVFGKLFKLGTGVAGMTGLGRSGAFTATGLNEGEKELLEMYRKLRELGYTEDQIAAMSDVQRAQLMSAGSGISKAEAALAEQGKQIMSGQGPNAQLGVAALQGNQFSGPVPGLKPSTLERLTGEKPTGRSNVGMSIPSGLSTKPMTPEEALKAQEAFMVSPEETEELFGKLRSDLELSQAAKRLQFDQSLPKDKAYEGLERLLNAQANNSAKEKDMVLAESLLNMAAGIQSTRSIIQGVAGGAISGLKGLRELNKAETERQKALATIDEARRAERIGNEKERLKLEDKLEDQMSSLKKDEINFLAKNIAGGKDAAAALYKDSVTNAQQNQRAIFEQGEATRRTQMTVDSYKDRVSQTKDPLEKVALEVMFDPLKRQELEALKKTNPALYNAIQARINALSALDSLPQGATIRR